MTDRQQLLDPPPTTTYFSMLENIREDAPRWLIVSGSLTVAGTSSTEPGRSWGDPYIPQTDATAASTACRSLAEGYGPRELETSGQAIASLRRLSGLTWDQLGELFGVSRRSVHFWASGKPLNPANEARLMRVLAVIQFVHRGDPQLTRRALFEPVGGRIPFDLLAQEKYEEVRHLLGEGAGGRAVARTDLSDAAKRARRPLQPEELADARHERAHRDQEGRRPARTVRNARPTRG